MRRLDLMVEYGKGVASDGDERVAPRHGAGQPPRSVVPQRTKGRSPRVPDVEVETHGKGLGTHGARPTDGVVFSVSATGMGMNEEQLGRLFQAFEQAETATSRKYGGTGLGLAISRKFCRMMGGDLTVSSEPGKRSVFTATIPARVPGGAAS